jgi:hypothetical protein
METVEFVHLIVRGKMAYSRGVHAQANRRSFGF